LPATTHLPIGESYEFFRNLNLPGTQGKIADKILREIALRLEFLVNVGLDYLTLSRSSETLSGGEAQRIRLASQIGAGLVGVMYVLDEPSIGLHQRDNARLLKTLFRLRDLGNTVIVVEHDEDAIRSADYVLDIGPGAGVHGGYIIAQGTPEEVFATPDSVTGQFMSGRRKITMPAQRTPFNPERTIKRATLFGTAGAGVIYILVCSAVVLMLPVAITSVSAAPFADFVNVYAGTNAGTAIAAVGAISALGALNGWIMCQAEMPAALARDGLFPAFMGKESANGTPRNAHLFTSTLLTLVILMNSSRSMSSMFEFLILLTTAIVLVMYFGCAAAAFRLMTKGQLPGKAGFKVRLLLAALYSCWTIYGAGAEALIWGVVLLLAGFPVFWLLKLARGSKPTS
jgi:hypothetical protein